MPHLPLARRQAATAAIRSITLVLWLLSIATFPIWIHLQTSGWDARIYQSAVQSVQAHHDPYAEAIAIQNLAHSRTPAQPTVNGPYSYVYSPLTLPIVRLAGLLPVRLDAVLFWLFYVAGALGQLWAGTRMFSPQETPTFSPFVPLAVFFPGFLGSDNIVSGNVAYMLYGAVLLAACYGWRRNRWLCFYLLVLIASCFKAPLLSLLAVPILSARRQWIPAALTALAGVSVFAVQQVLWPSLFRNYLQAVSLQFTYNRDFGFSPTGILGGILFDRHIPYSAACAVFYVLYAIPTFAALFFLSRHVSKGTIPLTRWLPVLLVGVILLNPRIMEYDVAPLALPLTLILWRFVSARFRTSVAVLLCSLFFLAVNIVAVSSWPIWKMTDAILLVAFFSAGVADLFRLISLADRPAHV